MLDRNELMSTRKWGSEEALATMSCARLAERKEPHLLIGHPDAIRCLAVDPLGRWIASASFDGTVRLWPMPDLSKPPLHTLPHDELIAKLESLTNLRAVRDAESSTGWQLTHDPFPGWETVPTW